MESKADQTEIFTYYYEEIEKETMAQKADTLRNDTLRKVNVKILTVFACLV